MNFEFSSRTQVPRSRISLGEEWKGEVQGWSGFDENKTSKGAWGFQNI